MANNIAIINNCYGCGVCATACSKKIIDIKLNKDGFYEPHISSIAECSECGLCLSVCSFYNDGIALNSQPLRSYATWSNDKQIRYRCSSGGIGFEIGKNLLENGYRVCAVHYNSLTNRAEHYIATNLEELYRSIGSKYIQSYTIKAFSSINRKEKNLVIGTPCQIDSFRRYIDKYKVSDNFVLVDFFCHSVPSMWAWDKYVKNYEKKIGHVFNASWRDKKSGWHDSWAINLTGERNTSINSKFSQGDIFYKLFLGDYCCNPACQKHCKFKYDKSSADLRIGDLWGKTYEDNEEGVSALVCFTERGMEIVNQLEDVCYFKEYTFEIVAEGQMKENVKKAYLSPLVKKLLNSTHIFRPYVWRLIMMAEIILRFPQRLYNKIRCIVTL